jgi:hypothetical protein
MAGGSDIRTEAPQSPKPISLDDIPLNRFHLKIAGLTFGAHFTEGYALGTVGYALTSLNRQMPLDSFWMGAIGSSALIGIFLGSCCSAGCPTGLAASASSSTASSSSPRQHSCNFSLLHRWSCSPCGSS